MQLIDWHSQEEGLDWAEATFLPFSCLKSGIGPHYQSSVGENPIIASYAVPAGKKRQDCVFHHHSQLGAFHVK